jgi:hypothetical protein
MFVATGVDFVKEELDTLKAHVAATNLNKGNKNALTVKLDRAYRLLTEGDTEGGIKALNKFVTKVSNFKSAGKLTDEQAETLTAIAQKVILNVRDRRQ